MRAAAVMYIGPWQEYKLSQQNKAPARGRQPNGGGGAEAAAAAMQRRELRDAIEHAVSSQLDPAAAAKARCEEGSARTPGAFDSHRHLTDAAHPLRNLG